MCRLSYNFHSNLKAKKIKLTFFYYWPRDLIILLDTDAINLQGQFKFNSRGKKVEPPELRRINMDSFSHVPPGFRFHPTDEELVDYYLRKKVASKRIDLDVIKEVDLYKIEPWDLQELCKIGSEEESEWYFFSHKDKKYPTGTRTNRATKAGFWKATGRDKAIYANHNLMGMRKTLVFYRGRAPNGQKSDWIMHEYRLETNENATSQEEGWVVCKVFKKKMPAARKEGEHESLCWYDDQLSFMPDFDSPAQIHESSYSNNYHPQYTITSCKQELEIQYNMHHHDTFLQLPYLESPKVQHDSRGSSSMASLPLHYMHENNHLNVNAMNNDLQKVAVDDHELTDWRVLDKFVASQLSQDDDDDAAAANL